MTDFPLYVTGWATVVLAIWHLTLTALVIIGRRTGGIVHGDNGDKSMMKRIRGHANASEQIPLALITLGLSEWVLSGWWTIAIAVSLILGRVLHGLYFGFHGLPHQFRQLGMFLTICAQIGSICVLALGLLTL